MPSVGINACNSHGFDNREWQCALLPHIQSLGGISELVGHELFEGVVSAVLVARVHALLTGTMPGDAFFPKDLRLLSVIPPVIEDIFKRPWRSALILGMYAPLDWQTLLGPFFHLKQNSIHIWRVDDLSGVA